MSFYRSFCSIFQLWIKGAALPLNSYKVRVVLFLENFDVAKGKCSNEKTIYENSLRNISLKYHYHPLSMDDPRMCKGIRFHVGHRTRLVVVPSNLGCGEIPLSCQKVYKGEPIDY